MEDIILGGAICLQARAKDIGWRIDYFCISKVLKENLKDSYILKDVLGSDHAPIVMEFK